MKPLAPLALAACAALSSQPLAAQPAPARVPAQAPMPRGPVEVNGIAAKVNGRVITKNQVSFMLAPMGAQLAAQYPRRGPGSQFDIKLKEAKDKVLNELVDRAIIMDEFKKLGASIKPQLIDEEIKRQLRELFNGDEAKFREELKRNRLTMEGYRQMTREKMIVQSMRASQFSDAPPPLPNEIQTEFEEVKNTLRDTTQDRISFQKIFIPSVDPANPTATPESQLSLTESLASQIKAGKDFAELAKTHSKDAFAEDGGIQLDIPRTDLSPEFASILFDSKVGEVVGPLKDPQGFTIVKPTQIAFGPPPTLDKVRPMIEERVRKKKTSAQYDKWIKSKRKSAIIDIRI